MFSFKTKPSNPLKREKIKKASLLLVMLLGITLVGSAQNLKTKKVDATFVNYPDLVLEGVDYARLTLYYAQEKAPALTGKKSVETTTNVCIAKGAKLTDAKELEVYYYAFETLMPAYIICAKDLDGNVVYATEEKERRGVQTFGKNECYFMEAILEGQYEARKDYVDSVNLAKTNAAGPDWAFSQLNEELNFKYYHQKVEIHYLKKGKNDMQYPELVEAMGHAEKAYKAWNEDLLSTEAHSEMELAITIWEEELAKADLNDKNARINKKIAKALCENLVNAYFFTKQFDKVLEKGSYAEEQLKVKTGDLVANLYAMEKQIEMYRDYEKKYAGLDIRFPYKKITYNINEVPNSEYAGLVIAAQPYYAEKARKDAEIRAKEEEAQSAAMQAGWQMAMEEYENSPNGVLGKYGAVMMVMNDYSLKVNKPMEEIPVEIYDFSDVLVGLTIKNNQLTSIPPEISKLENLKKLDLSGNQITQLPRELGELKNLKSLTLKECPLDAGELEKIKAVLPKTCKIKI
jgi:hypothetical protein